MQTQERCSAFGSVTAAQPHLDRGKCPISMVQVVQTRCFLLQPFINSSIDAWGARAVALRAGTSQGAWDTRMGKCTWHRLTQQQHRPWQAQWLIPGTMEHELTERRSAILISAEQPLVISCGKGRAPTCPVQPACTRVEASIDVFYWAAIARAGTLTFSRQRQGTPRNECDN